MTGVVAELFAVIQDRKADPRADSYTSRLLAGGEDEIIKKVGEECVEVVLAAKGQGNKRLLSELADLTYHCLVLLAQRGLSPGDVERELLLRREPIAPGASSAAHLG